MQRTDKENCVRKYKEVFQAVDFAFIFRCSQIPSEEMLALRSSIKQAGGRVSFVKNTLAKLAVENSDYAEMSSLFKGVSVLVTPAEKGEMDTYPAIVKSMNPFMKRAKDKLVLAGGVLQGKLLDKSALEEFGKMPTRMEVLGSIAFMLQYPMINVADTIKRAGESK